MTNFTFCRVPPAGSTSSTNSERAHVPTNDRPGPPQAPKLEPPDWQGCGFRDPNHGWEGGRHQYGRGRLDGFYRGNREGTGSDEFALGYYLKRDLGFKAPFLKLDTQGLDVDIVRSGRDIMHEFVGLQSELSMRRIYEHSVDFREAISFYQGLGFELSALVPNNSGCFPLLVEMDCIMVRSDLLRRFA